MEHQVMINQYNRRNFLKQAALGTGALTGLPSLDLPLLAADSGSRIKALEPVSYTHLTLPTKA